MKAVLISIQPKWCELITSGEKTVEVRKTKPKLETPFKVYIYCTKGKFEPHEHLKNNLHYDDSTIKVCEAQGKVIGEFICDNIIRIKYMGTSYRCVGLYPLENDCIASASKLSLYDMRNYLSCNDGYAWHISDLVIYDEPKELGEFYHNCTQPSGTDCAICHDRGLQKCWQIKRAPQSWCYVMKGGE